MKFAIIASFVVASQSLAQAVHESCPVDATILAGDMTAVGMVQTTDGYYASGENVPATAVIVDGILAAKQTSVLFAGGHAPLVLSTGQLVGVGPSVGAYERGCICRCGDTWVYLGHSTSNCKSYEKANGPCVAGGQKHPGFTDCCAGWGEG